MCRSSSRHDSCLKVGCETLRPLVRGDVRPADKSANFPASFFTPGEVLLRLGRQDIGFFFSYLDRVEESECSEHRQFLNSKAPSHGPQQRLSQDVGRPGPPESRSLLGKNQTLFSPSKRLLPESVPANPPDTLLLPLRPSYISRSRILGKLGSWNERNVSPCCRILRAVPMATIFLQSDTGESGKVVRSGR